MVFFGDKFGVDVLSNILESCDQILRVIESPINRRVLIGFREGPLAWIHRGGSIAPMNLEGCPVYWRVVDL